jgi:transcriptional regulator
MYQPAHGKFIELRQEQWHRVIRDYPLATLVTQSAQGLDANHVPFLLSEPQKLSAHLPRANLICRDIANQPVLVIFHGPDAYISPSWYPTKQEHGKVVPTWNYAIVHVRGTARVMDDRDWLFDHLKEMTDQQERDLDHPWRISDAPADYVDKMLGALVGIEIDVTDVQGKFKLGQNRAQVDQENVARELARRCPELETFRKQSHEL